MAARRAVIIGTGAGGLAAAAELSRRGFEVQAFEQAGSVGGYLSPFSRGEFLFDPGVHYVGRCRPGQAMHRLLEGLGIDASDLFCELDPDGFDVYRFPDFEVRVCRGLEAYRDRLTSIFPGEARGLAKIFELARVVGGAVVGMGGSSLMERLRALLHLPSILKWQSRTYRALLEARLGDRRARAVLAGACGDVGMPPGREAAIAGLSVLQHYADGAFFPRGGSGALRDALQRVAERHGARFRTGARVTEITTDGRHRATGVVLEGGERVAADFVVSDVNPVTTLGDLIAPGVLPSWTLRKARRMEPSLGMLGVYLGMRRDLRRHGMGRFNVWDYPDWDIDAAYAPIFEGRLPREPMFFLSPNSLKDDSGALAPTGSSTLEVYTFCPYALFERWRDRPVGARGPEYEAEKQRVADWLLEAVERRWPGLVGDVVVREVSTPLTDESYTGALRGGIYGPAMSPAQTGLRRFSTRTPVANLFLAGAGVFGDGILACLASGAVAARAVERAAAPLRRPAVERLREQPV